SRRTCTWRSTRRRTRRRRRFRIHLRFLTPLRDYLRRERIYAGGGLSGNLSGCELLFKRKVAFWIMKLVRQLNELYVATDLSRVVIFFDKPGVRNQRGDVQCVAKHGNVNRCPQKREMQEERRA